MKYYNEDFSIKTNVNIGGDEDNGGGSGDKPDGG